MTIFMFSGVPGSGKTLAAARLMRDALKGRHPRPVITNVKLYPDKLENPWYYEYRPLSRITPQWLVDYAEGYWERSGVEKHENHILLCVDEVQVLWNSRLWNQDKNRMEWLNFLSKHRKYGYQIIFVSQNVKMIDNQFRFLIQNEVKHRRLKNFGTFGAVMNFITGNHLFLRVEHDFETGQRLGAEWCWCGKRDYEVFDTYASLEMA